MSCLLVSDIFTQLFFKRKSFILIKERERLLYFDDPSVLKYLEDDADTLVDFGTLEPRIFKSHWKQDDKLEECQSLSILKLYTDDEGAETSATDNEIGELVRKTNKLQERIFIKV
eukprot:snap_masked-scaffold_3-processed-gene-9.33-mRNA-1 protein AED:1.00 eAED:1.00 QI:0/0/0/0/1/1/2/0/114